MGSQGDLSAITLPGVVKDGIERVDLSVPIGEAAVVLVSYPSNFGPLSGQSATLLRACERLLEERDAIGFGVAPESVYSHRRFAREAALSLPLLSDPDNEVASTLDVVETRDGGVSVPSRSLHVLDYRGSVVAEWIASDPADMPDIDRLGGQLESISPERSAWGCYRVGYAHYTEGRRLLSRGFGKCDRGQWAVAQTAFEDACREFTEATDVFMKGQGLADGRLTALNDRGRERSTRLWEAAEWLAGFALAAENGDAERKRRHRQEAARVLEAVSGDEDIPRPETARESPLASS